MDGAPLEGADGGWRVIDGGWRVTDGGWRVTDDGCRATDGDWRLPPPAASAQPPTFPKDTRGAASFCCQGTRTPRAGGCRSTAGSCWPTVLQSCANRWRLPSAVSVDH